MCDLRAPVREGQSIHLGNTPTSAEGHTSHFAGGVVATCPCSKPGFRASVCGARPGPSQPPLRGYRDPGKRGLVATYLS